jgi:hypothetical protein
MPRKAREHPALDRTDGLSESFRELRLAEAAVVRQLECFALLVRQLLEGRLHAFTFEAEPRIVLRRA